MKTLLETIKDGYYHVDSPLTKDDWLSVLCDENTPNNYIDALMRFYYEPHHESSCGHLGQVYPQPYASFNAIIRSLGMLVQKKFDFNVKTEDDDMSYWSSVMDGRRLGNSFSWKIKDELIEAIQDYLYRYLLNKYKEHRKRVPIDDAKTTEKYKWELITECNQKPLVEIAYRIRTTNLVYTTLANGTIDWLYKNRHDEYAAALEILNGIDDLSTRLKNCSKAIHHILDNDEATKKFKFAADDERTLSTILTCHDPEHYTFYMEKNYNWLCQFLGIEEKKVVGEKYPHFLQLLQPLVKLIQSDPTIHSIVFPSIKGLKQSDLLLAQDVCWEMFVKAPEELSYPPQKNEMPRYWCVGYHIDGESHLDDFVVNKTWKAIFRKEEDAKQLKDALDLKPGDRIILKTSFTKDVQHKTSVLKVQAAGVVTSPPSTFDPHREGYEGVEINVDYFGKETKEFNATEVGSYRNTIKKTTSQTLIDYVESLTQKKMDRINKYKKLLEVSHNLILTGSPGTGKTYLAKEIAASLIGCDLKDIERSNQFGFVQFHPSYDYTDFVEGLRPVQDNDSDGQIGFERKDGIFKEFCEKALSTSKPYIFVIDEINRGEISKIFGELFFSIDPGYRGVKGAVRTQYANLQNTHNAFDAQINSDTYGHFFVPSNVYIIGTMNDIDRSVESMDFAMRRRFAWKEVTAEESMAMLDTNHKLDGVREEIKHRMLNLNHAIEEMDGLGRAYDIGAAYFMKYADYGNFDDLWQFHLEGVLSEYLRGERNAAEKLETLHKAYNNTNAPSTAKDDDNQG